jgi:hypothetical protein
MLDKCTPSDVMGIDYSGYEELHMRIILKRRVTDTILGCVLNLWLRIESVDGRPCVIPQVVSRWLPTAAARGSSQGKVRWDLWWTKLRWSSFPPSTSVSPTNPHSTNHHHLSSGDGIIGQ